MNNLESTFWKAGIILKKRIIVIAFFVSLCLTACGIKPPYDTPNTPYEGADIVMNSVPTVVQKDAIIVGQVYGDSHPKVSKVIFGGTIDGKANMYRVGLQGNFVRKGKSYKTIYFSMLVDGSKIFSIADSNDNSKLTWVDDTLPK